MTSITNSITNSITGTGATGATPAVSGPGTGYANLGMADFLKLMTTQLKNQDPTAPTDNTQMVAQMAQFSSLSGINDMSTTLKAIAAKLDALTAQQAAAQHAAAAAPATTPATASATPAA